MRYKTPRTSREKGIQRDAVARIKKIIAEDFPRIMAKQYTPEAAAVFQCELLNMQEMLIEVPTIPPRGIFRKMFGKPPHRRGDPENFYIGQVKFVAQANLLR